MNAKRGALAVGLAAGDGCADRRRRVGDCIGDTEGIGGYAESLPNPEGRFGKVGIDSDDGKQERCEFAVKRIRHLFNTQVGACS